MKHENEENKDLTFAEQKIVGVNMEGELRSSFIQYAMSVIMSRALPDVRDGLKPVHRRILYAMYEDHLTHDKPFRKSATTVGNVLGRYHPHGDSSVYEAMVRLAQPFSLRYTLVEGHGNFGSIDGDPPAAYRYTEARLARLADEMTRDIEKNVVPFGPNFDNKMSEPLVLPSRFPNLLVNGAIGIAVGMATNIPTHNLGEVVDGTIYLMDNPDASTSELMQFIPGPDFPTGAVIYGNAGIRLAYETGHGRVYVRGRYHFEDNKRAIVFTEIPYMVNKANLVESIADCVKDKRIEGITGITDESGRAGMRIVIEYRRDANKELIVNQLFRYTQLQDTCAINMLALVDNVPRVLGLKQILQHYIAHQEEIIVNRTKFELEKALKELHLNEGYKIAADHIDEVIALIRASASIPDAKAKLMERFGLSDAQAQAIVDMTLGRLSGLERQKVIDRIEVLTKAVAEYRAILADEGRVKQIIKDDLTEIKRRFSDPRRTEIVEVEDEILDEDLIDRHTCVVTMTDGGYIKRQNSETYSAQRRGGKGIVGMQTKEEDFVRYVITADTHSYLMMFTNSGKVYVRKAYSIPEASRQAKGAHIANLLELSEGERITAMLSVDSFAGEKYLTMVTRLGTVKRTPLSEYQIMRKGGKIAVTLDEEDELIFVAITGGEDRIIIATKQGNAVHFEEDDVRVIGRTGRGVRGIRLDDGDEVAGAAVADETKKLFTVTVRGYGKLSRFDDYPLHNRGGKGVRCHNTERTGEICGIAAVSEDEDILLITSEGIIIRTPVRGIPEYGRTAGGVIVMRLDDGASVVNFATVAKTEEEDEDAENAEGAENSENGAAPEPSAQPSGEAAGAPETENEPNN